MSDSDVLLILKAFFPTLNGLATRVARQLDVTPSFVTRVIHGTRKSEEVDMALAVEYRKILVQHNLTHDWFRRENYLRLDERDSEIKGPPELQNYLEIRLRVLQAELHAENKKSTYYALTGKIEAIKEVLTIVTKPAD